VGETYVVEVPHQLPRSRYPLRIDTEGFTEWWRLQALRGGRFRLTVTELDTAAIPPMAEGIWVVSQFWVRVDLTLEQALELELPPGAYFVEGPLRDLNNHFVELPEVSTVRVPTRWLHPRRLRTTTTDTPRPRHTFLVTGWG